MIVREKVVNLENIRKGCQLVKESHGIHFDSLKNSIGPLETIIIYVNSLCQGQDSDSEECTESPESESSTSSEDEDFTVSSNNVCFVRIKLTKIRKVMQSVVLTLDEDVGKDWSLLRASTHKSPTVVVLDPKGPPVLKKAIRGIINGWHVEAVYYYFRNSDTIEVGDEPNYYYDWLVICSTGDQFVKLALAARPAGQNTPATSLSPSSSSSPESSERIGAPRASSPSATLGAATSVISHPQQSKHLQQQASVSTAYSTYSNASTATTGNSTLPNSDYPVVFVPVERGFMAREAEEWFPPDILKSQAREERALALERDRLVRSRSVVRDTILNLPVSVPMPNGDGEELYRGATSNSLRNNYDQHSEIRSEKGYIQGPPNKTVWDSPDWRDWDPRVPKPCSCSPGSSQPRPKTQSAGQLSSWGLHWRSSGKSPPSHSRPRCHHHQRHSHPSNSKNSCSSSTSSSSSSCKHKDMSTSSSSSTCSSTSSSTSSCAGLIVVNSASNNSNCASNNTVTILSSIGGALQNAFSCASTSGGGLGGGGDGGVSNPNYNHSSGMSRIHDETKFSPKNFKGNNSSSQQNSKMGTSHSGGTNDITRTQSSLGTKQENQSPPSSLLLVSNPNSSDLLLFPEEEGPSSSSSNNAKTINRPTTEGRTTTTNHRASPSQGQNQQLLSLRLTTKVDGGGGIYQTHCEDDSISFSQNLFKRVNETGSDRQNFDCSILNNDDDNGNRGGEIQPEQCIGDIQCRLKEDDVQYSSSSSDSTRDLQHEQNKHTDESECEPFLS